MEKDLSSLNLDEDLKELTISFQNNPKANNFSFLDVSVPNLSFENRKDYSLHDDSQNELNKGIIYQNSTDKIDISKKEIENIENKRLLSGILEDGGDLVLYKKPDNVLLMDRIIKGGILEDGRDLDLDKKPNNFLQMDKVIKKGILEDGGDLVLDKKPHNVLLMEGERKPENCCKFFESCLLI